jgi:single-strand DNA-binding protein
MPSVNKVIILGHLGRDPELRYMANGDPVCNFSVATSRQWKNKQSGEREEETEWHRMSCFGRVAEIAGEYLQKGRPVYCEGRLKTRQWEKDGVTHYTTEIIVESLQLLGSREDGEGGGKQPRRERPRNEGTDASGEYHPERAAGQRQPANSGNQPRRPAPSSRPSTGFDDMDDDIPF